MVKGSRAKGSVYAIKSSKPSVGLAEASPISSLGSQDKVFIVQARDGHLRDLLCTLRLDYGCCQKLGTREN